MLLDCLRMDLRGTGVAVTTINLGFVRTRMTEHSTHPMPQLLDAADAARRIVQQLRKRPATIDLPQPLAFATRLYGAARKLL
jgi:short-subunit dehydrogenase